MTPNCKNCSAKPSTGRIKSGVSRLANKTRVFLDGSRRRRRRKQTSDYASSSAEGRGLVRSVGTAVRVRVQGRTLRDAVHDLAGHFEAGRQTGGEGRGEVDGHGVRVRRRSQITSTGSRCTPLSHSTSLEYYQHNGALGAARAGHSSGAPPPRQHPFVGADAASGSIAFNSTLHNRTELDACD